jgi:hypothetical protein
VGIRLTLPVTLRPYCFLVTIGFMREEINPDYNYITITSNHYYMLLNSI